MPRPTLLDKRIAYQFKSGELRQQALTHRSYGSPHNERLEFLGDAVLSCAISEELYGRFPGLSEGHLDKLRASLVRKETLAALAQELGLAEFLRIDEPALARVGGSSPSMLADAIEALFGAVFLDGGYAAARDVIGQTFKGRIEGLDPAVSGKDAKTLLQEYLMRRKRKLPEYRIVGTQGADHKRTFEVECTIEQMKLTAKGSGSTRRSAEQKAAAEILRQIEKVGK